MLTGEETYGGPIGALFDLGKGHKVTGQINLKRGDLFESSIASVLSKKTMTMKPWGLPSGRVRPSR